MPREVQRRHDDDVEKAQKADFMDRCRTRRLTRHVHGSRNDAVIDLKLGLRLGLRLELGLHGNQNKPGIDLLTENMEIRVGAPQRVEFYIETRDVVVPPHPNITS